MRNMESGGFSVVEHCYGELVVRKMKYKGGVFSRLSEMGGDKFRVRDEGKQGFRDRFETEEGFDR